MLHQLGGMLLRALPTFVLVLVLNYYLKAFFFKPLGRVLDKRYEATEGARLKAQQSLELAEAKTAEYEDKIRAARAEIYHSQEQLHQQLQAERDAQLAAVRQQTEAIVREAQEQLQEDVRHARQTLSSDAEALANQITETILRRSAA